MKCYLKVLQKPAIKKKKNGVWIKLFLKGKKAKKDFNGFIGIVNESKHKQNKLWVDQGKEFYNSHSKNWLI